MATINIEKKNIRQYYFGSASGSVTRQGYPLSAAQSSAQQAAISEAQNVSLNYTFKDDPEFDQLSIGIKGGWRSTSTYFISSSGPNESGVYQCTYGYTANTGTGEGAQYPYMAQDHLKLNITGLSSSSIVSATLVITKPGSENVSRNFYVCAPKNNTVNIDDETYYNYNDTNVFGEQIQIFSVNSFPVSIDITDQLKQCINTNKNVLVITSEELKPNGSNYFVPSYEITYVSSLTACEPPTGIYDNGTGFLTSNSPIKLRWEGAQAGTNNAITGYRIYWSTRSNFIPGDGTVVGYYDSLSTNTNCSFNSASGGRMPSGRGTTYYFKICTRGSYAVNNAFLSNISEAYANITYNQLPGAPSVLVDIPRIKSTGNTTINFTVTPGYDPDTSQIKTLYYALSPTEDRTLFTSPLLQTLNSAVTYYFWTFDGYEFSENYTEKSIKINTPPTVTSITMSAVASYVPNVRNGYVKNINGEARVTKDPDPNSSLSYQWELQYVSGVESSINNNSNTTTISTASTLQNIDVTLYGATFNSAYRLVLTITDDVGETAKGYSSQIFGIPPAPTITFYNQHNNSNVSGTTVGHFDTNVRFKYSVNNTGINTIELWNGDTKIKQLNKNNNDDFIDTILDELTRSASYNLKLKFICNSISIFSNISQVYRAADIIPTSITITRQKDDSIKPYTHDFFNINFGGYISSDVSSNLQDIYTIKLNGENIAYDQMTASGSNISARVLLKNAKTTAEWKTLLGLNNAPNAVYTLSLTITATNLFEKTFTSNSVNVSLNFIENLTNEGSTMISIKNTNDTFTDILVENNNSPNGGYDSLNRYSLFETQIIKLTISGIQCYADQNADVEFYENTTKLGTIKINSNNWISSATQQDPCNHFYTLNLGEDSQGNRIDYIEFEYTIPKITSDLDVDYEVKVILANNQNKPYGTNLNICKYCKFNESEINFKIASIDKEHDQLYWECTNLGSNNLSSKICQFYTVNILSNNFDDYDHLENRFGDSFSINDSTIPVSGTIPTYDIVYFGAQLTLVSNFLPPDGSGGSVVPFGNKNHIINLTNLYTLYNQVPNLLYGKNFFLLNGTSIGSNSDGMLYLHTTGSRTKIYFGNSNQAEFEITQNGLIIDGGTWDT